MSGMKCPKCGSEDIYFGTNTSGGGFAFGDACCGSILLGPLGLLCGMCGTSVDTDEFWICRNCGNKFSNKLAQKQHKQEEENEKSQYEEYLENKKIRKAAIEEYGDIAVLEEITSEAASILVQQEKLYENEMENFLQNNSEMEEIRRYTQQSAAPSDKYTTTVAIMFIIALITTFLGFEDSSDWFILAIPLAVISISLWIYSEHKISNSKKHLVSIFLEQSPNGKQLLQDLKEANNKYKSLQYKLSKIKKCIEYEKVNNIVDCTGVTNEDVDIANKE